MQSSSSPTGIGTKGHRPNSARVAGVAMLLFATCLLTARPAGAEATAPRERLLLDFGWKFHLGNDWGTGEDLGKAGSSRGPAGRSFSDASWRTVNLPHDWAVELPFDREADTSHGFKPVGPGFPTNSVGWYRRTFELPQEDAGKRLWLEFDGVFRDGRVFVNGYFVGHHESGYSSFRYDITDVANCGGRNVVAVRVDASQFEGWFYEGAGIYRHVWLVKTAPVAIAPDGVFVYSKFKDNLPQKPGALHIQARLKNTLTHAVSVAVTQIIYGPPGTIAGTNLFRKLERKVTVPPLSEIEITNVVKLRKYIALWSPESPRLYKLVTLVSGLSVGGPFDEVETAFGIRTVGFDPDKGFLLNGHPYELKGTCNHQDHAGVGAALPDRLQYFRIAKLKEMGDNAIRTSHNAPTPELLEACDHLGMLVMDENRLLGSDAANLARLADQIRRDRNHPSVVVWSIANEEGVQTSATGGRIAATMQNLVHQLDPSRRVTYAANVGDTFQGINGIIDVRGWNYHIGDDMDRYHQQHPTQPEVGTEQASTVCTRGIYANDRERGYVSAYDDNAPPWAHTTEVWWKFFAARLWLSGGFAWTGFDYRGEPTPYGWPCINSHFGILDTCGFPKDNFFYYQAWWGDQPMVHLLPHWNWPGQEGQDIDVRCFSNCDEVELFLNGQSLGRQTMPRNSHLRWKVKYAPGTLAAKGIKAGQVVAATQVETTGAPAAIRLTPDRATINADGEDISVITVAVTDTQGRVVPVANNLVNFELSGPGHILGVGNGDPSCHEPDIYLSKPPTRTVALDGWRMQLVPDTKDRPEVAENFRERNWRRVDVRAESGPLRPDESAVFRTRFVATAEDLAATNLVLHIGMIDDDGWVYVNGQLVGESHDWQSSPSFAIRKFLHAGDNTIAVAVKNNEGQGGLNKGASVEIQDKPVLADWKRSAFNGLAQVIVQAAREAGEIKLAARAADLTATTLTIQSQPHAARAAVP